MAGKELLVLFGSETGNSEAIATTLHEAASENGFESRIASLNDYKKVGFEKSKLVLIVTSTTGNGEAPRNADRFFRYIKRRSHPEDLLDGVAYVVLGLGDTNYSKFCFVGQYIDTRMSSLGATRIQPVTCADEGTDLAGTIEPFKDKIWKVLSDYVTNGTIIGNAAPGAQEESSDKNKDKKSGSSENDKAVESVEKPPAKDEKVESEDKDKDKDKDKKIESSSSTTATTSTATATEKKRPASLHVKNKRKLLVMYGSETGNSEYIANDVHEKAGTFGYESTVIALNEFKKVNFPGDQSHELVVIISSTTGNGDAPRNGDRFVRFIKRRSHSNDLLSHVKYVVLGLGDTNYDRFCHVGKLLDKRMKELGAERLCDLVCADEAVGLEDVVEPWKNETLWVVLKQFIEGLDVSSSSSSSSSSSVTTTTTPTTSMKATSTATSTATSIATPTPPLNKNENKSTQQETEKGKDVNDQNKKKEPVISNKDSSSSPVTNVPATIINTNSTTTTTTTTTTTSAPTFGWKEPELLAKFQDFCELHSVEELERKMLRVPKAESCLVSLNYVSKDTDRARNDSSETKPKQMKQASRSSQESPVSHIGGSANHPIDARIMNSKCMTSHDAEKQVLKVDLELIPQESPEIIPRWQPGDALGVICPNPKPLVSKLLSRLKLDPKTMVNVRVRSKTAVSPSLSLDRQKYPNLDPVCSLNQIFRWGVDLTSIPRKTFLRMLSDHCSDPLDSARLKYLASVGGRQVFKDLIERQKPSLLEILSLFPSCQPPLDVLLNGLPDLAPRFYSIANSPLGSAGLLKVTLGFSVVETEMPLPSHSTGNGKHKRIVSGICSNWLANLAFPNEKKDDDKKGDNNNNNDDDGDDDDEDYTRVRVFIRTSSGFHLPGNLESPIIMIGPGTGVTPFIGFLEHRKFLKQHQDRDHGDLYEGFWRGKYFDSSLFSNIEREPQDFPILNDSGQMALYYGCRNETKDFLFRDFLRAEASDGAVLNVLRCAFSRQGPNKKYVQHLLKEDAAYVADAILNRSGYIYVCGDGVAMAKQVHQVLQQILAEHGKMNLLQAQRTLETLSKRGRYCRDIWS